MATLDVLRPTWQAARKWLDGVASTDHIPTGHIQGVVLALHNLGLLRTSDDPGAVELLRRLIKEVRAWDQCENRICPCCWCNLYPDPPAHEPDCPWAAAEAFLDGALVRPEGTPADPARSRVPRGCS